MNGLKCGIVKDLLPLYCDGVCSEESRAAVEEHMESCPNCREECGQMKGELLPLPAEQEKNRQEGAAVAGFAQYVKKVKRESLARGAWVGVIAAGLLFLAAFYLLPLLIRDTGSGMIVLLLLIPILCFVGGLLYGLFSGISWLLPIGVAAAFIPAILLYMNSSAMVYSPVFGVIALVGNLIGGLIRRAMKK